MYYMACLVVCLQRLPRELRLAHPCVCACAYYSSEWWIHRQVKRTGRHVPSQQAAAGPIFTPPTISVHYICLRFNAHLQHCLQAPFILILQEKGGPRLSSTIWATAHSTSVVLTHTCKHSNLLLVEPIPALHLLDHRCDSGCAGCWLAGCLQGLLSCCAHSHETTLPAMNVTCTESL